MDHQFTSNCKDQTPAESIATLVVMMFMGAMEVTAARALAPGTFGVMGKEADDPAWWARRTLSRLADCGVTPDGWEEAYFLPFLDAGGE